MPSTSTNGPTPDWEKHPETITWPTPCFMVGTWYLGSSLLFGGRLTYLIPSDENILNLLSSPHSTRAHSFLVQCLYFWANSRRAFLFFMDMNGFLEGRLPNKFALRRHCLTVVKLMSILWLSFRSLLMSVAVNLGLAALNRWMILNTLSVTFGGRPDLGLLLTDPVDNCLRFQTDIICLLRWKSLATCAWLFPSLNAAITADFMSSEYSFCFGMALKMQTKPNVDKNRE